MAPSESSILQHYLLLPSPLTSITTLEQFRTLFPRQWHSHPQMPRLFRDLQAQRNLVVDTVTENIALEARRGQVMRREVLKARLEGETEDFDAEVEIERALFGNKSSAKSAKHSLRSILPELEGAAQAMEDEIQKLQDEEEQLIASISQTVDNLGGLRYGELANPQLRDQCLDSLTSLQDACANKTKT
ncbi:hypothetical protein QQS21_005911 [Conoideocrella luteorostrata]|uniref:Cnl2/NKP2 family protein n=1 Tax=Conoideocrella luteorostrata TaxID=1105319 RepID=A0AAJ0FTF5_9HYPO|nr:hypothetical protein QQS21_005911 [Conoideocrella luteorostrata]